MTEIFLRKVQGVLVPDSESDVEKLAAIANGETIRADIKRPRNIKFHRRYFALLDVLFDIFEPAATEHKGKPVMKHRERFRHDIAIATGHYELVVNIKGEVRAEAKSISFAAMDDIEFAALYSSTINYGLLHIAKGKTREELENWTTAILSFD
jgi:hypothetical protein